MSDAHNQADVDRFTERFVQVMVDSGMPRVASRILVAILATDQARLTAAELADQLKASPAAISGGVRWLTQLNLVHRGREPGSRRDHFSVDDDIWYRTITQREALMARWSASLREGAKALGEDTRAGRRFAESVEFFDFIRQDLDQLVDRWEAHRRGAQAVRDL